MRNHDCIIVPSLIVTSLLAGCSRQEKPYEKPLPVVSVGTAEKFSGSGGARYSGNIEPYSRIDLAFKVGGYVQDILQVKGADSRLRNVQEGDRVAKGTVLARTRESDYAIKISQARSNLEQAAAAVEQAKFQFREAQTAAKQAKLDLTRATNLFESQSLTKSDYDGAKTKSEMADSRVETAKALVAAAEARVQGAKAQLEEAELALADSALKSPLDALVLKRLVEQGALVGPGYPAFVLADNSAVKVVFGAPDVLVPKLHLGNAVTLATEAIPGAEFQGHITRISPMADLKSRTFDVEITVPNPGGQLKIGMIASVEMPGDRLQETIPVVPLTAIVRSKVNPQGYAVLVLESQGGQTRARAHDVVLGQTFGNVIAVTKGLEVGERVIVNGATLVRDGDAVQVAQ